MFKKLLAMALAFAMLFALLPMGNATAYASEAEAAPAKTPIQKLVYNVTASGLTKEAKLDVMGAGWNLKTVSLGNEDGTRDVEVSYDPGVDGLINMGYAYDTTETEGDSTEQFLAGEAKVVVNKITVNGSYEIPVNAELNKDNNGLKNIWSGLGDKDLAYGEGDAYFAFEAANGGLICFYAPAQGEDPKPPVNKDTRSMQYVKAMGNGWNLGNSLESINANENDPDLGEESWGNPKVTRELLHAAKAKGFDSVRIPLTFHRRFTVNKNAGENEYKYIINKDYMDRAKEVIGWALDEGFYVMTNIHHDSWTWMKNWDGNPASEEYRKFTDFWKQLADAFKDAPDQLCFETMNEYEPTDSEGMTGQDKMMAMNQAAYDVIRNSGGKNGTRMIVLPSYRHDNAGEENLAPLKAFIDARKEDENIIATVHYYSEWVYASNRGKTGFDEILWDNLTPRKSADALMERMQKYFLNDGIGVIISEYGLLGYDTGDNCMQLGEEMKYHDYMKAQARENNVCLMLWDNGYAIDRTHHPAYEWKYKTSGEALEKTQNGRISYAAGLDTIYLNGPAEADVQIPLALNGNKFTGIKGLEQGKDYTYAEATVESITEATANMLPTDYTYAEVDAMVTLSKDYINSLFTGAAYGRLKDLEITFDNGYVWHEYLTYYGTPTYGDAEGTRDGIDIPVAFNGSQVRRVTVYQLSGRVGGNSDWWMWLNYGEDFNADYTNGTFTLTSGLLQHETVKDGPMVAAIEFYDGQFLRIPMNVAGNKVTCDASSSSEGNQLGCASLVVLYAGESEIPAQYITAPEGYRVYGISVDDGTIVSLEGWPAIMKFDTKAHETMAGLALNLCYMDLEQRFDITLGIKDAPVVSPLSLKAGKTGKVAVSNLAEDAVCTYAISDDSIGQIGKDGTVKALKAGKAKISVTVSQYGRKDTFEAALTVTGSTAAPKPAAVGKAVKAANPKVKGKFVVTDADPKAPKVSYTGIKNASSAAIPAQITDANGIKYRVTSIAKNAFKGNAKLKSVTIGKNVTSIGSNAFYGCKKLAKAAIGANVKSIGTGAFKNCTSLASVKIPNTVKLIGVSAFYGCAKLKSVSLGSGVTTIGDSAFYNCKKLSKVTLPKNVAKIGTKAFCNCKALKSIAIKTTKLSSKKVGSGAFKGIAAKASIKVPKSKLGAYKKLLKAKGVGSKAAIKK